MYSDYFFDLIGVMGFAWGGIALLYALMDYSFNIVMCWLTGGLQNLRMPARKVAKKGSWVKQKSQAVLVRFKQFQSGSQKRLAEFHADKLSWSWPLTILAIPTFLYGFTRTVILQAVQTMSDASIHIEQHRLIVLKALGENIQYILWGAAFILSFSTFYRYKHRSETTWFSKSLPFHLLRTLLFDFVLTYLILNISLLWIDFICALFSVLANDHIQYTILHPDLMYGLQPAYETVIGLSLSLLVISLLPLLMLIRERKEKYSKQYYYMLYGGFFIVFLFTGSLIYLFDARLENIQTTALGERFQDGNMIMIDAVATEAEFAYLNATLQYYSVVMNLPNGFPLPFWFEYVFGIRLLILIYEFAVFLPAKINDKDLTIAFREFIEKFL